jgi:hypothetical protein
MRDGTARIWIDPVAWDDAVATYFQEIANVNRPYNRS